ATGQRAPAAPSKRTSVRSDWTREARCIFASPVWVRVMCRRSRTRDRAFVEQERCHRVRVNDAEWLGGIDEMELLIERQELRALAASDEAVVLAGRRGRKRPPR